MKNEYKVDGNTTTIFLKRKNGEVKETLISTSDLERAKEIPTTWYARWDTNGRTFYVSASLTVNGKRKTINLHRWLLNVPSNKVVDHINRDTLNNTRSNLRIVNHQQNSQNKDVFKNNKVGIRGVSFHKASNKWRATITKDGKSIHLGVFENIKDAERASIEARKKYMPFSN